MRLSYVLGLCCLLMSTMQTWAQKVILSEPETINVRADDFSVIGTLNEYIAVYRKAGELPEIILYSPYMRKYKTIALPMVQAGFSRIYFSSNGQQINVFYQQREQRQDRVYRTSIHADYRIAPPKLLAKLGAEDTDDRILFDFAHSPNNNYQVLFSQYRRNGRKIIRTLLVGPDSNQVTDRQFMPEENERELYGKAFVSNSGQLFFLLGNRSTNKGYIDKLSLMRANTQATEFTEQSIALGKMAVGELQWAADSIQAFVGGCFSDGKFNEPKGVFFFRFDTEHPSDITAHFTPMALLADELSEMRLRQLHAKKDGGLEFVLEKYSQQVRTLNTMSPVVFGGGFMTTTLQDHSRTVNEYYYNQIQLINLKSDGSMQWIQTILKDQQSTDDGGIFSSFGTIAHPLGHAYVFNELENRDNRLMIAYVNSQSRLNMKELPLDEETRRWSAMPRSAKQLSGGELVMPCVLKNNLCFLKISF